MSIAYRRKRQGKTNYKRRLALLRGGKPRLVVRATLTKIIVQIVEYADKGDVIKIGIDSSALKEFGWKGSVKNTPAAYLTGYLLGKKSPVKEAVLDIGLHTAIPGIKLYAVAKGAKDAGLNVPCGKEAFPKEERILGKHIKEFPNNIEQIKKAMESA